MILVARIGENTWASRGRPGIRPSRDRCGARADLRRGPAARWSRGPADGGGDPGRIRAWRGSGQRNRACRAGGAGAGYGWERPDIRPSATGRSAFRRARCFPVSEMTPFPLAGRPVVQARELARTADAGEVAAALDVISQVAGRYAVAPLRRGVPAGRSGSSRQRHRRRDHPPGSSRDGAPSSRCSRRCSSASRRRDADAR